MEDIGLVFDDMTLNTFKIVMHSVRFLDIWNKHVNQTAATHKQFQKQSSAFHTLSSELSCRRSTNLASERLELAYNSFQQVLRSFFNHQSSPLSLVELLLLTRQSVESGQTLLSLIESIYEFHSQHSSELEAAKNTLYERIIGLVHAIRDTSRLVSSNGHVLLVTHEGNHVASVVTQCIDGADTCMTMGHRLLKQAGGLDISSLLLEPSLHDRDPVARDNSDASVSVACQEGYLERNDFVKVDSRGLVFSHELTLKDGQIIGGSLRALVEKLTNPCSAADALFVSTFYLTFRLFTSPDKLAEALTDRYNFIEGIPTIAEPVRLQVYNFFKEWLESHWRHEYDITALRHIFDFAKSKLVFSLPHDAQHLLDLAEKAPTVGGPIRSDLATTPRLANASTTPNVLLNTSISTPAVRTLQLNKLNRWKNLDTDINIRNINPLELARQLTIKMSRIFCAIRPEELLETEWTKKSGSLAINVRAMSTVSNHLTIFVSTSILEPAKPKKRAINIRQWIKVAIACLELNNYDSLMAIVCALTCSGIARLKRTWNLVSITNRTTLATLEEIMSVSRNYKILRHRQHECVPPAVPFLGVYLSDLTFIHDGNCATRTLSIEDGDITIINYDKYVKTTQIIRELQRFQIPYQLAEIPSLYTYIQEQLVREHADEKIIFQKTYHRSLVLEPREEPRGVVDPIIKKQELANRKLLSLPQSVSSKWNQ